MLKRDAGAIYKYAISESLPNEAVKRAIRKKLSFLLEKESLNGEKLILVSIGKAGWEMAKASYELLGDKITRGIVITKYDHSKGRIGNLEIWEASHPVVDFLGIQATKRALELTQGLSERDIVLFLVSGGGSALFESVSCPLEKMQELTSTLLKCGAEIGEINAIRKHISNVKGGRFAAHVYPAKIFSIALSDVVGNDLSTIASGPACPDNTTVENCLDILKKYNITLDNQMLELIKRETPKEIKNATHIISGSVCELCSSAKSMARKLGYTVTVVNDSVACDISVLEDKLCRILAENKSTKEPLAFIFGGEITIKVKGDGKGGRNQELALRMAEKIKGMNNVCFFSVGSDGTDGPTDSAGGFVDGSSWEIIEKTGKNPEEYLKNNDSYNALKLCDGLIMLGATGTNVNDLYTLMIRPEN